MLSDDKRPILFYAGDGVSDLSAAKESDLLFAKAGHGKHALALDTIVRSKADLLIRSRYVL
jgi:2-hydroxy-3-keto-5-methylthiopentenyl-1-phosphate phosphatase